MGNALLVDAGFSARPLKNSLEKMGYRVHTVGMRPTDALASENPDHHLVDYSDFAALSELVRSLQPVNVVPGCTDLSYEMCCQLATSGVVSNFENIDALRQLHDKAAFRSLCASCDIPAPEKFSSVAEALSASCPLVIKPTDGFSGKGITILEAPTTSAVASAVDLAMAVSRTKTTVIEQFIPGQLFSFSAFLSQGEVDQAFSVAEFGFVNPMVVDTSYVLRAPDVERKLSYYAKVLSAAVGVKEGLIHIQYILTEDGPCLIEVTRRCPGDLYSDLISESTGFDYAARFVGAFLPNSGPFMAPAAALKPKHIVRHTLTGTVTGNLASVAFNKPESLRSWYPLATSGAALEPSPAGRVGVAFYEVGTARARDDLVRLIANNELVSICYSG